MAAFALEYLAVHFDEVTLRALTENQLCDGVMGSVQHLSCMCVCAKEMTSARSAGGTEKLYTARCREIGTPYFCRDVQ